MTTKDLKALAEKYTYSAHYSRPDAAYVASCTEAPGLHAHGDTAEEAIEECKIACVGWLEMALDDGEELPEPIKAP
jgi:antitoxin HicB